MSPAPTPPPAPTLSPEDLDAYLERIAFGPPEGGGPASFAPDLATLATLHRSHALAIPFENLSLHGRDSRAPGELPIRLDLPSLVTKLVYRRRGGYCFEQNSLFQAVLQTLGFAVTAFEARVRMAARHLLPRTHMALRVDAEGEAWLCDVGFGGDGLLEPVPLDGREAEHGFRTYRVIRERPEGGAADSSLAVLVLQARGMPNAPGWLDLYALEPRPVQPVDLEVANWYTSTWPESAFVKTRTAQRITPETRFTLRGRTFTVVRGREGAAPEIEVRELADDEEVERVLRDVMDLEETQGPG